MKQYGKSGIAFLLTALCALPAIPAGAGATRSRAHRNVNRYPGVPTFADSTSTDDATYDDPEVRAAAVAALGKYNGAVVAVDPNTGRILTVVNQKLAFGDGYIPCSTIKPTIALAALEENVITPDTMLRVSRALEQRIFRAAWLAHGICDGFEVWPAAGPRRACRV